jgi:para-aminobenzoate synthetase component 1
MPTQEVARAAAPSALLQRDATRCPIVLDGAASTAWLHGEALYSSAPSATLEIFASGWGRWWVDGVTTWRRDDPFAQWDAFLARGRDALGVDADGAGFLTVLAYDLKHWIERLPRRLEWPCLPVLYCALYDWSYRADRHSGRAHVAAARADLLADRLHWYDRCVDSRPSTDDDQPAGGRSAAAPRRFRCPRPALSRDAYVAMIARAQEYIAAGDVYEINLAQPFTVAAARADAAALFAAWADRYPMPFAAYVDGGAWTAVSNSPECFLLCDGERVATFPIKGTRRRPRGASAAVVAAELRADPKEQAEHVMVVDLERNDLGRVCATGSVEVTTFATVHEYPLLSHMVSEVRGRLRPGISLAALVRAMFPGGSISGAPKIRAMQLIEELEPAARGFYTGAIGWTDMGGASQFNIAIRTAVFDAAGTLTFWAGGGIVADSVAEREYDESLLKAESFFRSLATLNGRAG